VPWEDIYEEIKSAELAILDSLLDGSALEQHMEDFYLAALQEVGGLGLLGGRWGEGGGCAPQARLCSLFPPHTRGAVQSAAPGCCAAVRAQVVLASTGTAAAAQVAAAAPGDQSKDKSGSKQ
jgi:hypothetical protein